MLTLPSAKCTWCSLAGIGNPALDIYYFLGHPVREISDRFDLVDYYYELTEANNNSAASPGYQLFFWDESSGLLSLLAEDDLLGVLPGDLLASETVFGGIFVAPGDVLLMAIDDGGNSSSNDRVRLDGYISLRSLIVPEPTTLLIWSLLAGLGIGLRWRRRR